LNKYFHRYISASYFNVPRSHIYLVHDDLDRPVGKESIKVKGSAG